MNQPLKEIEQGMLFLWMRQNCTMYDIEKLRKALPEVCDNIFGPPTMHGIPGQLFEELRTMVRGNRIIEALRHLRAEMGWTLKDAKDFIETHCR